MTIKILPYLAFIQVTGNCSRTKIKKKRCCGHERVKDVVIIFKSSVEAV